MTDGTFTLHLLNVGQGEALIFDFPDGSFGLLDAGPQQNAGNVLFEVRERLNANRRFRFAGATQWDRDHIAGFVTLLREVAPEEFVIPGIDLQLLEEMCAAHDIDGGRSIARAVGDAIDRLTCTIKPLHAPEEFIRLNGVQIFVVSPTGSARRELRREIHDGIDQDGLLKWRNRTSLCFWIRAYGRTLFLAGEAAGDQYREMDQQFLKDGKPLFEFRGNHAADWIKLSHHGARSNNTRPLFQFFAKRGAFVGSASAGGRYGHPHPAALRLLHHESGGIAMCTRLGQGCAHILRDGIDPSQPEDWLDDGDLVRISNPHEHCYGKVSVRIEEGGSCSVIGSDVQGSCPYGGPAAGTFTLPPLYLI